MTEEQQQRFLKTIAQANEEASRTGGRSYRVPDPAPRTLPSSPSAFKARVHQCGSASYAGSIAQRVAAS